MLRDLKSLSYRFYRWLFKDKIEAILSLIAFATEMAIGLYYVYRWGSTYTSLGDRIAHLHIARVVIDNGMNSGFANLGTVWLPVFHVLLIPLVSINILYTTGLAGTIVNGVMTAGICVLVYRLVHSNKKIGILASVLFLLNPYTLLRFGCSAWMRPTGMFFMLLAIYYFQLYWEKDATTEFMKCSLALILGSLSRYEIWPVAILITIFFVFRELKNKQIYRLSYAHFPFWGIFAWIFYNLAIFRDPLIWIFGPFPGAQGYYGGVIQRILHPSVPDLISYGIPSIVMLSGHMWTMLPIAIVILVVRKDSKRLVKILLLIIPLLFIFQPGGQELPRSAPTLLYFSLPGIILSSLTIMSMIKTGISAKVFKVVFTVFLIAIYLVDLPSQSIYVLSYKSESYNEMRDEIFSIKNVAGEGSYFLMSSRGSATLGRSFSVFFGVSPSKIIDEYDYLLFSGASKQPWKYCEFAVIEKTGIAEEQLKAQNEYYGAHFLYLYYYDVQWREEFLTHYRLTLETSRFLLYETLEGISEE